MVRLVGGMFGTKEISVTHVASPFQHADFLTKAISWESLEFHCNLAMNIRRDIPLVIGDHCFILLFSRFISFFGIDVFSFKIVFFRFVGNG